MIKENIKKDRPQRETAAPARMTGEQRRRQIMKAAVAVFSAKGFSGATTKEIACRARITVALIFRYFDSKDALYEAILEERIGEKQSAEIWRKITASADENDDFRVFQLAGKLLTERKYAEGDLVRMVMYGILEKRVSVARLLEDRFRPIKEFLSRYIERRQNEKAFRPTNPEMIINAFIGMAVNHMLTGELCGSKITAGDNEKALAVFSRLILADLRSHLETDAAASAPLTGK